MANRLARGALIVWAMGVPAAGLAGVGPGCSGGTTIEDDAGSDAGADGDADVAPEPVVTELTPEADPLPGQTECKVTITTGIPLKSAVHVPVCSDVAYATNPPSGGDHWGVWVDYATYEEPVPREMYVHNMEHGAVVLLHRCEGDCPEVLAMLEAARHVVEGDPKCLTVAGGPTERVVITPDPELDVPVAAAAWGATYEATCLDPESLEEFVKKAYDHAPESTCFELSSAMPVCMDGMLVDAGTGGSGGSGGAGGTGGG